MVYLKHSSDQESVSASATEALQDMSPPTLHSFVACVYDNDWYIGMVAKSLRNFKRDPPHSFIGRQL